MRDKCGQPAEFLLMNNLWDFTVVLVFLQISKLVLISIQTSDCWGVFHQYKTIKVRWNASRHSLSSQGGHIVFGFLGYLCSFPRELWWLTLKHEASAPHQFNDTSSFRHVPPRLRLRHHLCLDVCAPPTDTCTVWRNHFFLCVLKNEERWSWACAYGFILKIDQIVPVSVSLSDLIDSGRSLQERTESSLGPRVRSYEHLEIIPWWCFVIRLCSSCCAEQIFLLGRRRKAGGGAQTGATVPS